ncbi:cysteine hydrolase family protein [Pseudalkalibacillus caeni]|uniref:Cysteine hydrolase n=1 Tax=Exobacillus caeni TaxID=2574798 RepID=A0A5R9F6N7_9BACL|nr:cysteine hydrolase family protein [Pseudalkalibacillus caeni]TLS37288.1 cysteine hydrolase [Pseudalkalibacillus caeni]
MNENTALVIIDMQNAMFQELNPVYNGERLLNIINRLIEKARESGALIIFVQHEAGVGKPLERGSVGWKLNSSLHRQEEDLIIEKKTPDSFYKTKLNEVLQQRNIQKLILAGIQTEACVDTTCRGAFSHGYDVMLVKDGHSTWDSTGLTASQIIAHHNNVLRWFADVKDAEEIV